MRMRVEQNSRPVLITHIPPSSYHAHESWTKLSSSSYHSTLILILIVCIRVEQTFVHLSLFNSCPSSLYLIVSFNSRPHLTTRITEELKATSKSHQSNLTRFSSFMSFYHSKQQSVLTDTSWQKWAMVDSTNRVLLFRQWCSYILTMTCQCTIWCIKFFRGSPVITFLGLFWRYISGVL